MQDPPPQTSATRRGRDRALDADAQRMPHAVIRPETPSSAERFPRVCGAHQPVDHAPAAIEDRRAGPGVVEYRDRLYRRSLALADLAATTLAMLVVVGLLRGDGLEPSSLLILPLVVVLAKLHGLYDRDELLIRKTTVDEAPRIFQLATLFTLLFWLAHGTIVDGTVSPAQALALWLVAFVAILLGRRIARSIV